LMFGLDAPVVIGPMNGGMSYPPAFAKRAALVERVVVGVGRKAAMGLHAFLRGKTDAAVLLVANVRSKDALPKEWEKRVTVVVENGVDLAVFDRSRPVKKARKSQKKNQPFTLVFAGRLVTIKAVDILIDALAQAQAALPALPMELVIVGDGPERAALERLAAQLHLENVRFTGWKPQAECADIMSTSDVFLMSSLLECGGAVILEAMAYGKPVVCTAWGGPLDYVNASTGILIEPSSRSDIVRGFRDAIVRLANDAPLRKKLGDAGRARIETEFDWEAKVDRMLEIYAEASRK
jgi:glycosyltransferase involved in cell wall biosynthesis